jgi:hypothetical protein
MTILLAAKTLTHTGAKGGTPALVKFYQKKLNKTKFYPPPPEKNLAAMYASTDTYG